MKKGFALRVADPFSLVVVILLLRQQSFDSAVFLRHEINDQYRDDSDQHRTDDDERALHEEFLGQHVDDRVGHGIEEPVVIPESDLVEQQEQRVKIYQREDPDESRKDNGDDRAVP